MFKNKKILLGVSSSVAIYKALELVRLFKKQGADVYVMMTSHSTNLVSPQLFQAVSGNRVASEQFETGEENAMSHIGILNEVDLVVLAPATASLIGRYAMGLATDLLTTTLLGTKAPVLLAPAMNTNMYEHPIVQNHLETLCSIDVEIVDPKVGELACGIYGAGHLADLENILFYAKKLLVPQDLKGKQVLISSGRTLEAIDPVRVLTNHSSGKMGLSLAQTAWLRGATVTIISGIVDIDYPVLPSLEIVFVRSALEMYEAVLNHFKKADIFVSAAAVSDFRPREFSVSKLKKIDDSLSIELVKNPDILQELSSVKRPDQQVVGFALETDQLLENAGKKFRSKKVNLLVANSPSVLSKDSGDFVLFYRHEYRSLTASKLDLSTEIFDTLSRLRKS